MARGRCSQEHATPESEGELMENGANELTGERVDPACARCGERPASELLDGRPTCQRCGDLLRAKAEEHHNCPVDQTEMKKEIIQNLIIDRCPSCGGVWLDHEELVALLRLAAEKGDDVGFLGSMLLGLAW